MTWENAFYLKDENIHLVQNFNSLYVYFDKYSHTSMHEFMKKNIYISKC